MGWTLLRGLVEQKTIKELAALYPRSSACFKAKCSVSKPPYSVLAEPSRAIPKVLMALEESASGVTAQHPTCALFSRRCVMLSYSIPVFVQPSVEVSKRAEISVRREVCRESNERHGLRLIYNAPLGGSVQ
eukprot:RCo027030